ncbi:MAG: hypothetical protein ACJ79S_01520, partial [Gemmatimonadaceae bacterium]
MRAMRGGVARGAAARVAAVAAVAGALSLVSCTVRDDATRAAGGGDAAAGGAVVKGARIAVARPGPDGEWAMPAGDYASSRYSPLAEITPANAKGLRVAWAMSTGVLRGHEGQPLVVDNTMYVVTPYPNVAYAIDLAQEGQPLKWKFRPANA